MLSLWLDYFLLLMCRKPDTKHLSQLTPMPLFVSFRRNGLLLRVYTQNIDNLERVAGINDDLVIQTHGDMNSCGCVDCKTISSMDYMTSCIQDGLFW